MRFITLSANESALSKHSHLCEITADDLTQTTTATAQTLTAPFSFPIGSFVERVTTNLPIPFQNSADGAFNTDTFSVGDSGGGVATILAAIEVNANGTFVTNKTAVPAGTPATGFTTVVSLTFTFNSQTAKALNSLNLGNIRVMLRIVDPVTLANGLEAGPILTK